MLLSYAIRALFPLVLTMGVVSPLWAQSNYPSKPIRMVVPYAPGGGSDIVARIVGQKMSESLGQTVVVDNRPGAAGMLGAELAASSAADGYTLLLADSSYTINAAYFKQKRYDAQKSFVPVSLIADTPYLLLVHPTVATATVTEFIALAKAQPGKINIGSAGAGSGSHLIGALMMLKSGVRLNHIPYKGSGPATADVVAGQIQSTFATAPGAVSFIKAGRLKALVSASAKRSATLPDVPTFSESGFKDILVTNWYGVVAPIGTAPAAVQKLYMEIGRAIVLPDVRDRLASTALEPIVPAPGQFEQLIDVELKRWAAVIRDANIPTE